MMRSKFYVCPSCGYALGESESSSFTNHLQKEHKTSSGYLCKNQNLTRYSLGYRLKTDALCLRINEEFSFEEAFSVLQAIILSSCNLLNIDNSEIAGCLQYVFNGEYPSYEFIVYDTTPGGAGHVKRLVSEETMQL